jgi:exopolysaccharide biosynthesis polyprenyl glycosylphosphotransferase
VRPNPSSPIAGADEAPRLLTGPPLQAEPGVVTEYHSQRDWVTRRVLLGSDVLGLLVALLVITVAWVLSTTHVLFGLLALPGWIVLFNAYGLYDREIKRLNHGSLDDLPHLFHALLLGSVLMWVYFLALPVEKLRFDSLLGFAATLLVCFLTFRAVGRRLVIARRGPERVLLIGEGEIVALLARKMRTHPEYAAEPVGVMGKSRSEAEPGLPHFGDPADVRGFMGAISNNGVDRVLIARSGLEVETLVEVIRSCRHLHTKVSVVPEVYDALGQSVEIDDLAGVTVLGLNPPVLSRSSRVLKRTMDILGAGALLIVCSPALLGVAAAVKIDSKGPILFRQRRVGRYGRRFDLLKFRTMVVGAEAMQEGLRERSRDPHWLLIDDDPRLTRIGKFLRHTSLDELPQLFNVLRGEMSLVGPRPVIESEDRQLVGWRRSRVDLTPGLTGLWQVLGRTTIPFEEMVKLDYLYVTNWSLWTDIRLMLQTLPVVLTRRGVN